jgi:hypothetical protein
MKFIFGFIFLALTSSCKTHPSHQMELVKEFAEFEQLEKKIFDSLVFVPVANQINKSIAMKFILEDQLKRKWLFKASRRGSSDGIVAMSRFYNLLGQDTPEAHYKTFVVNGQPLEGTVQRFVPNIGPMSQKRLQGLTPAMADYLARSHLLDWLFANNQVHHGNFLILGDENQKPNGVLRIDNSINWFLMGQDRIDIDYVSPLAQGDLDAGYLLFWRNYLNRAFELPLAELLSWAHFVSGMPDEVFRSFLSKGIENNLEQLANNGGGVIGSNVWWQIPEVVALAPERFLPTLLERKNRLGRDAERVYGQLAKLRKESLPKPLAGGDELVVKRLRDRLGRLKASLEADKILIESAGKRSQQSLEMLTSINGYDVIRTLRGISNAPQEFKVKVLAESGEKLKALSLTTKFPLEKMALENAQSNLAKMKALAEIEEGGWSSRSVDLLMFDLNRFFEANWAELDSALAKARGR